MEVILLTHISRGQVIGVRKGNFQHKTLHFSPIEKPLYYDLRSKSKDTTI